MKEGLRQGPELVLMKPSRSMRETSLMSRYHRISQMSAFQSILLIEGGALNMVTVAEGRLDACVQALAGLARQVDGGVVAFWLSCCRPDGQKLIIL
jgi:fructose-1,6-bisphosphatase/inositol monophosphatase family enzyme